MSNDIDTRVAKALGWVKAPAYGKGAYSTVPLNANGGSGDIRYVGPNFNFSPSTRLSNAWEVIGALDRKGFGIHITRVKSISTNALSWAVDVNQPHDNGAYGNGDDPNVCVAICQAALAALGSPLRPAPTGASA